MLIAFSVIAEIQFAIINGDFFFFFLFNLHTPISEHTARCELAFSGVVTGH